MPSLPRCTLLLPSAPLSSNSFRHSSCVSNVSGEGLDMLRLLLSRLPSRVSTMAKAGVPFAMTVPIGNGLNVGGASASGAAGAPGTASGASASAEPAVADSAARRRGPETPERDTLAAAAEALIPPHSAAAEATDMLSQPGETTIDSIFNVPGACLLSRAHGRS
jgi:hypothetical protein